MVLLPIRPPLESSRWRLVASFPPLLRKLLRRLAASQPPRLAPESIWPSCWVAAENFERQSRTVALGTLGRQAFLQPSPATPVGQSSKTRSSEASPPQDQERAPRRRVGQRLLGRQRLGRQRLGRQRLGRPRLARRVAVNWSSVHWQHGSRGEAGIF